MDQTDHTLARVLTLFSAFTVYILLAIFAVGTIRYGHSLIVGNPDPGFPAKLFLGAIFVFTWVIVDPFRKLPI